MDQDSGMLSGTSSPAATTRSPEDEDLLQRSTKKTKRPRERIETTDSLSSGNNAQEAQLLADLKSPESAQWRTPVETPNTARGRKEILESFEKEAISEDEEMNEGESDPNCPIIHITKEEKERLRRPWRRTLIIKVLGQKVSYSFLLDRLHKMWKPESSFDLIALDQDYYLAKFESLRDNEFAKYEGPWIILGHYITVQEWRPNFLPRKSKLEKLLVWIRFSALPIEYFDDDFLKKIGKEVGRPIKVDYTTSLASKGKFARICVELDMTKRLLSKFTLAGEVMPIEYEGIHMVCFRCGIFGHKQGQCEGEENKEGENAATQSPRDNPTNTQQPNGSQRKAKQTKAPVHDYTDNYGAWMLVTRKEKGGPRRESRPPGF
ncbi:uncharacterized protein LOC116001136 [Ipomoea triloba]|uniref:uncharacterized protein LOC116001136 n=1 Tax=Ipomoea triloba TaxID=35885 RepID=UPI00125CFFB7|nr:uncharacterized protein LOC116001136 [Ipomoea triloba]